MIKELIQEIVTENPKFTIKYRIAHEPLDNFDWAHLRGFDLYDHTSLPENYAKAAHSIILVAKNGCDSKVLGGVLFLEEVNLFRTRQLAPAMKEVPFGPWSLEMNGLWLSNELSDFDRLGFWALVCEFLCAIEQNTNVVFSYDTRKKSLDRWYRTFPGHTLYEGTVLALPGMSGEGVERVGTFETDDFKANADRLLVQRMLAAGKRANALAGL